MSVGGTIVETAGGTISVRLYVRLLFCSTHSVRIFVGSTRDPRARPTGRHRNFSGRGKVRNDSSKRTDQSILTSSALEHCDKMRQLKHHEKKLLKK